MNMYVARIVIIGNGFDLANGYKTSYNHFMYNLLYKQLEKLSNGEAHKNFDQYISIQQKIGKHDTGERHKTLLSNFLENGRTYDLKDVRKFLSDNSNRFSLDISPGLISKLYEKQGEQNWVDIEEEYFNLFKLYTTRIKEEYLRSDDIATFESFNESFEYLTDEFVKYLKQVMSEDKN